MSWEPQNYVAAGAALIAAGTALVTYRLGKAQIASAKEVARLQIEAAQTAAQRQIDSAQAVAQRQVESAQSVARLQLVMPMREAWIGQLRDKLASFITKCAQFNLTRPTKHNDDTFGLLLLRHEIHLMLNPADESHQRLHEAMKKMVDIAEKTLPNDPTIGESVQETTALAHHVLAAEWKRARAGE